MAKIHHIRHSNYFLNFKPISTTNHGVFINKITARKLSVLSCLPSGSPHRRSATNSSANILRNVSCQTETLQKNCNSTYKVLSSPFGEVEIPEQTLTDRVFSSIHQWKDKPMITCGSTGRSYKYGEGRVLCRNFAKALLSTVGLKKGDVVGLLMPNIPEYVIAIHGALEAGLTVTFVNPLYTVGEIKRQFENAEVTCIVTVPQLVPVAQGATKDIKNYAGTIVVGSESNPEKKLIGFQQILAEGHTANVTLPQISVGEVALLPYSSGTTGMPKGVRLTHKNCTVNLEQSNHPDFVNHVPTSDTYQERVLSVLPFFHSYGFNGILNVAIMYGMHMITIPKFTPEAYIECVLKYRPTILFVVPSLLLFLASHPAVTPETLSSIKEVTSGAAPATKSLIDKFKYKLGRDDVFIRQGYGMSETSPCTMFTPWKMSDSKLGSVGQLVKGTQARVVSLTTKEDLDAHQSGELYVKGPQVMEGYLKNEEATKETIDDEGWLHTGDVAYYDDDHFFYIVDRTKELIKVKGNQVSPTELESIIMQIPGVADAAVVGIPDILSGEIPRAFVVRRPGSTVSEDEIVKHVEPKVAAYKKLSGGVRFLDMIPRNPAGKVLRNELKVFGNKEKQ